MHILGAQCIFYLLWCWWPRCRWGLFLQYVANGQLLTPSYWCHWPEGDKDREEAIGWGQPAQESRHWRVCRPWNWRDPPSHRSHPSKSSKAIWAAQVPALPSLRGRVPSVQSSQSAPHLIIADSLPLAQVLWRQHWRPTRPNVIIELFHFYNNHDLLPLVECKISFDPLVFFMLVVDHYQFSEMCTETQKKGIPDWDWAEKKGNHLSRRKETKSNSSFLWSWMLCWVSNGLQLQ